MEKRHIALLCVYILYGYCIVSYSFGEKWLIYVCDAPQNTFEICKSIKLHQPAGGSSGDNAADVAFCVCGQH